MYNLHQLGWYSFQQLAITVAKEVFGQTVFTFLPSKDGGRDGGFFGTWKKNKNESIEGQYVFQCKFTNQVNRRLQPSDLNDELQKIQRLVNDGICDFYILFTNNRVSGNAAQALSKKLAEVGVKHFIVFDNDWIVQTIKENNRLRMLVPRVYGLGDLMQILDARVYEQGKELLESLKDDLAKVVITSSYKRAAKAIAKHGFVLLIGGPASGKTTIASSLAMGAMDSWKSLTMKLQNADEVVKHWDSNGPGQFFWIDDAFGVTRYEPSLVRRWNHAMLHVKAMLKKNVRIIMTSRDYIYEDARKELKTTTFPMLAENMVVIDVLNLSDDEKRQILYNHIRLGDQPLEFKKEIKQFLEPVSVLKEFLPETARRLGTHIYTTGLQLNSYRVKDFVVHQRAFFIDLLGNLDKHLIAALALIYMNDERLTSPLDLSDEELKSVERLDSSIGKCRNALEVMRNNIVQLVTTGEETYWKFKHPTIGDAFSDFIKESPELIEIYLRGCGIEKLIHQVSCGNLKLKNTIVVSSNFYDLILGRLQKFTASKDYKNEWTSIWGAKRDILDFLAKRCSKDFLKLYLQLNEDVLEQVSAPTHYIEISSELELIHKLHSFKLLPEQYRLKFVDRVTQYAMSGQNLFVFKLDKIRVLFKPQELAELRQNVVSVIVPKVQQLRIEKEAQYDSSDDPGQHMSMLVEVLEILEGEFTEDEQISKNAAAEIAAIKTWVDKNEKDNELEEREKLSDDDDQEEITKERSIFDDIDSES